MRETEPQRAEPIRPQHERSEDFEATEELERRELKEEPPERPLDDEFLD